MSKLKVKVEKLLPGGEALAYLQGIQGRTESYRLRNAVPGDMLQVKALDKRRGNQYAEVIEVDLPSKFRIDAACPVAHDCGGCALQYLQADQHAEVKSAWVKQAFVSVWQKNTLWHAVESNDCLSRDAYLRRRLRWYVAHQDGQVVLGFFAKQSHQVVATQACMVISSELGLLRQCLEQMLSKLEVNVLPQSIYALQLADGIHVVLEFDQLSRLDQLPDFPWQGMDLQFWLRDSQGVRPLNRPVKRLHDALPTGIDDMMVAIGPDDFVQGQMQGNREMIEQLHDWCEGHLRIVDLFSGAGNLSLPLAAAGKQVIGAEVNEASVRAANANAKRLKLNASYQQADLFGNFDVTAFVGAEVLIIDPPRKGAGKICQMMNCLLPLKVILIHCDVLSAQRDAKLMQQQGYQLSAVRALDLFPYSGHVESLSLWQR
ncbi:MAG: 23S rRNA methyltransferase [Mariprofundaceae bacterium]